MNDLNDIVDVTISRTAQSAASRVAFGIPAIIGAFATNKTTATFDRHRSYTSLIAMIADGWTIYDREYQVAEALFAQNPAPSSVVVGRKASGDATWTATLDALQLATPDWYAFSIIPTKTAKFTFAGDLITGNTVDIVINGVTVAQVTFSGDMQTTMGLIEAAVEAALAGSVWTTSLTPFRIGTLSFTNGSTPSSISITIAGGASQTTCTVTMGDTGAEDAYKLAAAWAETQVKLFFMSSSAAHVITADVDDIATFMKNADYDRTIVCYNPEAMSDLTPAYQESAWVGRMLPEDPGTATWCYKTLEGVDAVSFTPTQRTSALGKNANIYESIAGIDCTEEGKVSSGEYIDIMMGIDYMTSELQAAIFTQLTLVKKIPFTDEGVLLITSQIQKVLEDSAALGIIVKESIVVSAPAVADVSAVDKAARLLPDVTFSATLQGAIHKTTINGYVTL